MWRDIDQPEPEPAIEEAGRLPELPGQAEPPELPEWPRQWGEWPEWPRPWGESSGPSLLESALAEFFDTERFGTESFDAGPDAGYVGRHRLIDPFEVQLFEPPALADIHLTRQLVPVAA